GTPVGATPEILRALCPTLVFRGPTPALMAEDLERFLGDKERDPAGYARLRQACREHVERHYTWERATDELEQTLHRMAGAGRNGKPARRAETLEVGGETCPGCGGPTRPSARVYRGVRYRRCPTRPRPRSLERPPAADVQPTSPQEDPRAFAAVPRRDGRHGDPGQCRRPGSRAAHDPTRGPPCAGRRRAARAPCSERSLPPSVGAPSDRARPARQISRMGHVSSGPPLRVHALGS